MPSLYFKMPVSYQICCFFGMAQIRRVSYHWNPSKNDETSKTEIFILETQNLHTTQDSLDETELDTLNMMLC